jgi:predicted RNase H-like HicB family nuclease
MSWEAVLWGALATFHMYHYAVLRGELRIRDDRRRARRITRATMAESWTFETEQECDGQWIAECVDLPDVYARGPTEAAALRRCFAKMLGMMEGAMALYDDEEQRADG